MFSKMRAKLKHLKRHNRVYTLSSENNYRPMRARIITEHRVTTLLHISERPAGFQTTPTNNDTYLGM